MLFRSRGARARRWPGRWPPSGRASRSGAARWGRTARTGRKSVSTVAGPRSRSSATDMAVTVHTLHLQQRGWHCVEHIHSAAGVRPRRRRPDCRIAASRRAAHSPLTRESVTCLGGRGPPSADSRQRASPRSPHRRLCVRVRVRVLRTVGISVHRWGSHRRSHSCDRFGSSPPTRSSPRTRSGCATPNRRGRPGRCI
jgi:hypothetical protein